MQTIQRSYPPRTCKSCRGFGMILVSDLLRVPQRSRPKVLARVFQEEMDAVPGYLKGGWPNRPVCCSMIFFRVDKIDAYLRTHDRCSHTVSRLQLLTACSGDIINISRLDEHALSFVPDARETEFNRSPAHGLWAFFVDEICPRCRATAVRR